MNRGKWLWSKAKAGFKATLPKQQERTGLSCTRQLHHPWDPRISAGSWDLRGSPGRNSAGGGKQSQAYTQLAEVCFKSFIPWFGWKSNTCLQRRWLMAVDFWPGSKAQMVNGSWTSWNSQREPHPKIQREEGLTYRDSRAGTHRLRTPKLSSSGQQLLNKLYKCQQSHVNSSKATTWWVGQR